jgi:hypothetical protein
MIDTSLDKVINNFKMSLEIEIKTWLERNTPPTEKEWAEYKRKFNRYIEVNEKHKLSTYWKKIDNK